MRLRQLTNTVTNKNHRMENKFKTMLGKNLNSCSFTDYRNQYARNSFLKSADSASTRLIHSLCFFFFFSSDHSHKRAWNVNTVTPNKIRKFNRNVPFHYSHTITEKGRVLWYISLLITHLSLTFSRFFYLFLCDLIMKIC